MRVVLRAPLIPLSKACPPKRSGMPTIRRVFACFFFEHLQPQELDMHSMQMFHTTEASVAIKLATTSRLCYKPGCPSVFPRGNMIPESSPLRLRAITARQLSRKRFTHYRMCRPDTFSRLAESMTLVIPAELEVNSY